MNRMIALIGAALAAGNMQSAIDLTPGASMFRRDFSRSRWGTRSNKVYRHKNVRMTRVHRDMNLGIMWVVDWHEFDRPMRRAERKGVPGVPRGHGDINSIRF